MKAILLVRYIIIYVISAIALLGSMPMDNAKAVSYNGSSTYSLPWIYSSTGPLLYSMNTSYGLAWTYYDPPSGWSQALENSLWFRFSSGSESFSGLLMDTVIYLGTGAVTDVITRYYIDSSNNFRLEFWDWTNGWSQYVSRLWEFWFTWVMDTRTCSWLSSDCILVLVPHYIMDNVWFDIGLYFSYVDSYFYYGSWWITNYLRHYVNPTWTSHRQLLKTRLTDAWLNLWMLAMFYKKYDDYINTFWYWDNDVPKNFSMTQNHAFFYWISWNGLDYVLPDYLWSSGSIDFSPTPSIPEVSCDTLDFGCHISAIWNTFLDYISPDISFTWTSETCVSSGSTLESTSSLSMIQKLTNLFVVAIPVAPPDGSTICTLTWQQTISYEADNGNIIDIFLIIICILPIFFSASALHTKTP